MCLELEGARCNRQLYVGTLQAAFDTYCPDLKFRAHGVDKSNVGADSFKKLLLLAVAGAQRQAERNRRLFFSTYLRPSTISIPGRGGVAKPYMVCAVATCARQKVICVDFELNASRGEILRCVRDRFHHDLESVRKETMEEEISCGEMHVATTVVGVFRLALNLFAELNMPAEAYEFSN